MEMERDETEDKSAKLAEALKRGWRMLSETCPRCGSPLFQAGDEVVCAVCGTKYVLVSSEEEAAEARAMYSLMALRDALIGLLDRSVSSIELGEVDHQEISRVREIVETVEVIERILREYRQGGQRRR